MAKNYENTENESLKSLMNEAHEMYKGLVKNTESNLQTLYGFKRSLLEESLRYPVEDLKTYDAETIEKIYNNFYIGPEEDKQTEVEEMREDLIQAKEMCKVVFQTMDDYKDLEKTYGDVLDEQWKRNHSKKFYDIQMKRVKEYETMLGHMPKTDPDYKKIKAKVDALYSSLTMDFMLERVRTLGEKEQKKVMLQFFNKQEGDYVMNRCASRATKFGLPSVDWYKFFFNLEQNHLPVEYHVFNNLFLFATMRFIAYADPYDKKDQVFVRGLISNLTGLIYHKFDDSEMEEMVIELIMAYDKTYEAWRGDFDRDNINHPNHPQRLAYESQADKQHRDSLLASIDRLGIAVPETVDTMTTKELHEYFNAELEKMIEKEKDKPEPTGQASVEEAEDGTVSIAPSFNLDKYRNPVWESGGKFYFYNESEDDSFFKVSQSLHNSCESLKNYRFMLELKNPDVPTVELWEKPATAFTDEEIAAIQKEAAENIWYFLRFCISRDFSPAKSGYRTGVTSEPDGYRLSYPVPILHGNGRFLLTGDRSVIIYTALHSDINLNILGSRMIGKSALIFSLLSWFVYRNQYVKIHGGEDLPYTGIEFEDYHRGVDIEKTCYRLNKFLFDTVHAALGEIKTENTTSKYANESKYFVITDNTPIGLVGVDSINRKMFAFTTIPDDKNEEERMDMIHTAVKDMRLLYTTRNIKELCDKGELTGKDYYFVHDTGFSILNSTESESNPCGRSATQPNFFDTCDVPPIDDDVELEETAHLNQDVQEMVETLGDGKGISVDEFLNGEVTTTEKGVNNE